MAFFLPKRGRRNIIAPPRSAGAEFFAALKGELEGSRSYGTVGRDDLRRAMPACAEPQHRFGKDGPDETI
ncbi:MAG: hypothetical protein Q8P46_03720 [Hyphomicrobiales bacterium]|nr:hypothetical protein [Hyphomicrobiales bacterium]